MNGQHPDSPPVQVSVIIATYNRSNVLPFSIGSVLRQTFTDFELLVVGDGCTDDSEAVVRDFRDTRVRWIPLPTNSGHQSEPNNEGLRQARGQYIAYLGHDDLWLPHHLSCLVALLSAGADMAYGLTLCVGTEAGDRFLSPATETYTAGATLFPSSVVHNRRMTEQVGGWRLYHEIGMPPDGELWLRAHKAGFHFARAPRLTVIKFPGSARRNVYKLRSCHEQEAWFSRIRSDDHLEAEELIRTLYLSGQTMQQMPYPILWRRFFRETRLRLVRRLRRTFSRKEKGARVKASRRLKGLDGSGNQMG